MLQRVEVDVLRVVRRRVIPGEVFDVSEIQPGEARAETVKSVSLGSSR
jgi:hypothetical protein